MLKYRIGNSNSKYSANSYCKFSNNLCGTISNTHCNSLDGWWNLLVGTRWTNYFKHYSVACFHNNVYGYLYFRWMFKYRIRNSHGECASNSYGKFSNNLCWTISNAHCNSINGWWNLLVGTRWTNHFKHYCVTSLHNNVYCYL